MAGIVPDSESIYEQQWVIEVFGQFQLRGEPVTPVLLENSET